MELVLLGAGINALTERLILRVPLLHVGLLEVLLHDLQADLRRRADADVFGNAGEDLRQILLLVIDDLLLARLGGTDDAFRDVGINGRDKRLEERGPIADAVAVTVSPPRPTSPPCLVLRREGYAAALRAKSRVHWSSGHGGTPISNCQPHLRRTSNGWEPISLATKQASRHHGQGGTYDWSYPQGLCQQEFRRASNSSSTACR